MPNDKDNNSGHAQNGAERMLTNFILLTLPWLALQLETLAIIKKGIEKDKEDKNDSIYIKPIQHLVERELHAVMMILDPQRKLRNLFDADLEKKLVDEFIEIFEKLPSGLVNLIEVQEIILNRTVDILKKLKNGKNTKSYTSTQ
jgi:hypothetical protein